MPNWIILTQLGGYLVMAILLALSVWSITIMIERRRVFQAERPWLDIHEAKALIRSGDRKAMEAWARERPLSIAARALLAALESQSTSTSVDRAIKGVMSEERSRLEKGFTVLATLGSNAPFIGLFGTVLGIIQAFGELSAQQGSTQSVIGGISEALVATAVGLFVAIPAVVAYNVFIQESRAALGTAEQIRDLYIAHVTERKA
jgi:biopolymer transport protein ExbB/TolQ